eukprot:gene5673-6147_t
MTGFDRDEAVELLCGHRMHAECGRGLVQNHLKEGGRQPLTCPQCPYAVVYDDYIRLSCEAADAAAAQYERDRVRDVIARRGALVGCPYRDCTGYAVRDVKEGTFENLFCV